MKTDGSITIDTKLNTDGMTRGVSEIKSSMNNLGGIVKKIGVTIAGAFAVKTLIKFGQECLRLGSDLAEVQNVVEVTFPTMTSHVEEFARTAADSFGLSETMAKRYVGTFGSMAKSFGYSESAAYDMATALTGLTGDVASFYNISQDLAYTKLKSVFTGETETLKDLGVVMTQSALDQYALANGYGKTTAKMTEQEKVALRLKFVQDQLSAASGDFARTSDSWANQVRIMQLRLESLKATIGQGLINLFTPVIKAINAFLAKLEVATHGFKNFTEMITGRKSTGSGTSQEAAALGNMQEGYEGAAESAEQYGDAVEDAGKKAKKSLAPFDELATLQEEAGEEKDALGPEVVPPELSQNTGQDADSPFLDNVVNTLGAIKERLLELGGIFKSGFWEGMGNYKPILDELKKDLQSIGGHLIDIFTDSDVMASANRFVDSFVLCIGRIAGAFASIGLTIASNLIGGFEIYLSENVDRIKGWLITMFDIGAEIHELTGQAWVAFADVFSAFSSQPAQEITASIIQIFSDVFMGVMELTGKFFRDLQGVILTPFIENKEKIKTALMATLEPLNVVIQSIRDTIRKIVDEIIGLYDEHVRPFLESVRDGITEIAGVFLDNYTKHIAPVLDKLASKFKEVMEGPVGDAVDSALNFLGKLMDALKQLWENVLVPLIVWIEKTIIPVVAPILEILGKTFLDVFGTIADIRSLVFDILSGLIDMLTGQFSNDWLKVWEGMKNIVESVVNTITKLIDRLKSSLDNSFAGKLADFIGGSKKSSSYIGGGSFTRTAYPTSAYSAIPYRMPRLATGTVVPPRAGEFAAILGDNKKEPEVVSPLSTMKQALKEALAEAGMNQSNSNGPLYLQIDGRTFARLMNPYIDSEKNRVGVKLITDNNII